MTASLSARPTIAACWIDIVNQILLQRSLITTCFGGGGGGGGGIYVCVCVVVGVVGVVW